MTHLAPSRLRRSIGHLAIALCLASAFATLASHGAGAALASSRGSNTGKSASTLAKAAVRNADRAGWVHEVILTTGQGHRLVMANDVGAHTGRQVISVDGGNAKVIGINGDAYIEGNETAIANYFGLPNPQQLANRWLVLTPNEAGFSTVSAGLTLKSDFHDLTLKGVLKKGAVTMVDGVEAIPIHGHISNPAGHGLIAVTLYVPASGAVLPLALRGTGNGLTTSIDWTSWGHPVTIAAPSNVTPLSDYVS